MLVITDLLKRFASPEAGGESVEIVRVPAFSLEAGAHAALRGESGSGKTTFLNLIAGILAADEGKIVIDGDDMVALGESARDRIRAARIGYIFQTFNLLQGYTVLENVILGMSFGPGGVDRARARAVLERVGLGHRLDHFPRQLSTGQQQRVAVARALAHEPAVLVLDEPFGALDAKVRTELRRWLRRLHEEIHVTSVFVTHDQEEALEVADRVVVMSHGRIEQVGTPEDVYHHPANPFVFQFLGNVNVLPAHFNGGRPVLVDSDPAAGDTPPSGGSRGRVFVRPHMMDITTAPRGSVHFRARVIQVNAAGSAAKVELVRAGGEPVHVELTHERYRALRVKRGDEVFVIPRDLRVFLDDNGATADRTDLNAE